MGLHEKHQVSNKKELSKSVHSVESSEVTNIKKYNWIEILLLFRSRLETISKGTLLLNNPHNRITSFLNILTNKEDDSVKPVVSEDKGNDEEGNTKEHSHAGNQMDEMVNFFSDWGLAGVQSRSQASNTTHHLRNLFYTISYGQI